MNPLEQAVESALKANLQIGGLFDKIGMSRKKGFIIRAYDAARRDLQSALESGGSPDDVRDVFETLKTTVDVQSRNFLGDVVGLGKAEALHQMRLYGYEPTESEDGLAEQYNGAVSSAVARVEVQFLLANAIYLSNGEPEQIVGNDDSPGVLRWSEVTNLLAFFTALLYWQSFSIQVEFSRLPLLFQKQAIAVLDHRTTDCCKRVHGQVQKMNDPFILKGEPRFADAMDWPGFHWHCRTGVALYDPKFDYGLTERLLAEGRRALGK